MRYEYINEGLPEIHDEKMVLGGEEMSRTVPAHTSVFFDAEPGELLEIKAYALHGYDDGETLRRGAVSELCREVS